MKTKEAYITVITNRIEVMMYNTDLEDIYPGGIHVVHEQKEGEEKVEFTFFHNKVEITDPEMRKNLIVIFYDLVGDSFE